MLAVVVINCTQQQHAGKMLKYLTMNNLSDELSLEKGLRTNISGQKVIK